MNPFIQGFNLLFRKPAHGPVSVKVNRIACKLPATGNGKPIAVIEYPRKGVKDPVALYGQDVDYVVESADLFGGVVVKIYSPGGAVTTYGYLYEQTKRLRKANLEVTAIVDEVAASGGYLMLLPANKVIAGEFAVIGSIGVVATVLNFHDLLSRNGVLAREYTAGEFKRTVSPYNQITPELEVEFRSQLEEIAVQFREVVMAHRPQVGIELLNGKVWSGKKALELGLIDELGNSNEYLMALNACSELVLVAAQEPAPNPFARLARAVSVDIAEILSKRITDAIHSQGIRINL